MNFVVYILLGGFFSWYIRRAHPKDYIYIPPWQWMIVILLWPIMLIIIIIMAYQVFRDKLNENHRS